LEGVVPKVKIPGQFYWLILATDELQTYRIRFTVLSSEQRKYALHAIGVWGLYFRPPDGPQIALT